MAGDAAELPGGGVQNAAWHGAHDIFGEAAGAAQFPGFDLDLLIDSQTGQSSKIPRPESGC
jgi:hypothetical protein